MADDAPKVPKHAAGCWTSQRGRVTPSGWVAVGRDRWRREMRSVRLTGTEKAIVYAIAEYANKKDGKSCHPGNARIAWESCTAVITVRRTLEKLQRLWLIHCYECGNGRGHATEWWLTLHDDMPRLVAVQSFEDWTELYR